MGWPGSTVDSVCAYRLIEANRTLRNHRTDAMITCGLMKKRVDSDLLREMIAYAAGPRWTRNAQ